MFTFSVCIMSDDEEDEVGFKGTIHFNITVEFKGTLHFNINLGVKSKATFHYNNSIVLMIYKILKYPFNYFTLRQI